MIHHVFPGPFPYNQPTVVAVQEAFATAVSGLVAFGLFRLAQLLPELRATRGELADLALERERLTMADHLRAALGDRLEQVTDGLGLTLRWCRHNPDAARRQIAVVSDIARRALADARDLAESVRRRHPPKPHRSRPHLDWLGSSWVQRSRATRSSTRRSHPATTC